MIISEQAMPNSGSRFRVAIGDKILIRIGKPRKQISTDLPFMPHPRLPQHVTGVSVHFHPPTTQTTTPPRNAHASPPAQPTDPDPPGAVYSLSVPIHRSFYATRVFCGFNTSIDSTRLTKHARLIHPAWPSRTRSRRRFLATSQHLAW